MNNMSGSRCAHFSVSCPQQSTTGTKGKFTDTSAASPSARTAQTKRWGHPRRKGRHGAIGSVYLTASTANPKCFECDVLQLLLQRLGCRRTRLALRDLAQSTSAAESPMTVKANPMTTRVLHKRSGILAPRITVDSTLASLSSRAPGGASQKTWRKSRRLR